MHIIIIKEAGAYIAEMIMPVEKSITSIYEYICVFVVDIICHLPCGALRVHFF